MDKETIKKKYRGMYGVFTYDLYKAGDEAYANSFLGAFASYKEAVRFANGYSKEAAIHVV